MVNGDTQAYEAENRQISSTFAGASETYLYDGDGQRVEKSGPSGTTVFVTTPWANWRRNIRLPPNLSLRDVLSERGPPGEHEAGD